MLRRTCLFLALALAGNLALAQQQAPPIFWLVSVDVPMAHVAEYDATVSEIMSKIRATEEGKSVRFLASTGPETGYSWAIPMESIAEHETMMENWGKAIAAARAGELMYKAAKLAASRSEQILRFREDLSYAPSEPSATEQSALGRHFNWWYARSGHEAAIEAVAKEFVALYTEHGIDSGFRVYEALTGPDLPAYMVAITAQNPADFYAADAAITGKLGEAGQTLQAKAASHARRIEMQDVMIRPDLSIMPQAEE